MAQQGVARIVYSPKCWAFVKNTNEEIMDLTEYIIGGEIHRLLNQVSTAKITLRNPDRIFTRPGEVAFHPQDPITIFLERTPGHPVQVFTGFLDKSPYYQMRPGPITLEASCTLKRLLYNWYQLAQPYTLSLLENFGWVQGIPNETGEPGIGPGEVAGPTSPTTKNTTTNKWEETVGQAGFKNSTNGVPFGLETEGKYSSNDGAFANLLWAILYFIGDWQDEKIWIENVPASVPKLINKLWNDYEQNDKDSQAIITRFFEAAIGTHSYGKGGGPGGGEGKNQPTGNLTTLKPIVETMTEEANRFNVPPEFVICTALCEEGFDQEEITKESGGALGWFQFQFNGAQTDTPYSGKGNSKSYTREEAIDTSIATAAFCKAAISVAAENPNLKIEGNWEQWATKVQGSVGYADRWNTELAKAKGYVSQYPISSKPPLSKGLGEENPEEIQRAGKKEKTSAGQRTRLDVMISRASEISNKNYPYSYGGGHPSVGTPSMGTEHESGGALVNGFDCSGSVLAVLAAGGFVPTGSSFGTSGEMMHVYGSIGEPGPGPKGKGVTIYANSEHEWMTINGRYFSTGWNKNPKGGAGWGGEQESEWPSTSGTYESMHLSAKQLEEPYTGGPAPSLAGTEGETGSEAEQKGAKGASMLSEATAAAFASRMSLPSEEERIRAEAFKGQKALMNAQPLMPFVQQVCESSLRSFQSLPNGDFYAFYPDYFGEFGHHDAYWLIYDIEILDGGIELSDTNLVTHVFSLGNPMYPAPPSSTPLVLEEKAGVMTIFEAMDSEGVLYNLEQEEIDQKRPGVANLMNSKEAVEFLQRYGPRVLKESYPMVTSTIYECLLAYQQFLLGWSRQFETPFSFTFMPELFPGGKVGFPEHGIQMYIEEVTHTWDTTNGYQTYAKLTAPSVLYVNGQPSTETQELPPNMVDALIEPLRNETKKEATAPPQRPALPQKTKPSKTNAENSNAFGGNNAFQKTGF
jgi:cell wall-associated NlpC family hydrolase